MSYALSYYRIPELRSPTRSLSAIKIKKYFYFVLRSLNRNFAKELLNTNEITPAGTDNSCFLPMKKSTFLQILGFVAVSILFLLPTNTYAQNNNLTVVDGKGTYYTPREGKGTASGEPYRRKEYTCAHRTLPFGTRLMVTNLKNQKAVVVRVNDRGPFTRGFVVDLTYAGAEAIDIVKAGVVPVHLEVVGDSIPLGPISQAPGLQDVSQ